MSMLEPTIGRRHLGLFRWEPLDVTGRIVCFVLERVLCGYI